MRNAHGHVVKMPFGAGIVSCARLLKKRVWGNCVKIVGPVECVN